MEVVPTVPSHSVEILDKLGPVGAETTGLEERAGVGVGMGGQQQALHQRQVWLMFHKQMGLILLERLEVSQEVKH